MAEPSAPILCIGRAAQGAGRQGTPPILLLIHRIARDHPINFLPLGLGLSESFRVLGFGVSHI